MAYRPKNCLCICPKLSNRLHYFNNGINWNAFLTVKMRRDRKLMVYTYIIPGISATVGNPPGTDPDILLKRI